MLHGLPAQCVIQAQLCASIVFVQWLYNVFLVVFSFSVRHGR